MAIAGFEPVSYLEFGGGNKTEIYTREQVREILVKFAELIDVEADVDFNWKEEPEVIGYDLVVENTIVRGREDMELAIDEFMKMGD